MQQETMQRTSQGEFVRVDTDKVATHKEEGLLSSLWHKAGDVVHAIQETTAGLLDQGLEKTHDAIVAGEEFIETESGKASSLINEAKESEMAEKAQSSAFVIGHSIQEFASIIMEQAKELHTNPIVSPRPSQSAIDALVEKTEEILHSVTSTGAAVADKVTEAVTPAVEQAVDKVTPVISQTKTVVTPVMDSIVDAAVPVVEKAIEVAAPVVEKAQAVVAPVVNKVVNAAIPVVEKVKAVVAPVVEQAVDAAAPIVEGVVEKVSSVGAPLRRSYSNVEHGSKVVVPMKRSTSNRTIKGASNKQFASLESGEQGWNSEALVLTMDVVSHVQRIADRTGDAVLHETARRAHSACAKGLSEAPGVHLTWITPQQANDLVNLAIRTQDHELADFARYCQSVAATTHVGVEPTPGKIQAEIQKGYQELQKQGRVHMGPGYGAAFASVNRSYPLAEGGEPVTLSDSDNNQYTIQKRSVLKQRPTQDVKQSDLVLSMDVVSHVQRIADRTGNATLHETAKKAHSVFAKGLNDAPGVHLVHITPAQASELMNLASKSPDQDTVDFARYCQSVASTTQIGVEPAPGKIQELISIHKTQEQQQQLQQEQPQEAQQALE